MASQTTPIFSPNKAKMKSHLSFLFGGIDENFSDGMIEISILNKSEYFPVTDINSAVNQAAIWNEQGHNVYTCGAILSPNVIQNIQKRKDAGGKSARAEGADFYASNHVWVDIDEITEEQKNELKSKYAHCPPNFYVITGRVPSTRVHLWWMLDKTVTADNVEQMELANKGLISNLFGDKGTHNRTRLMRLGGSISWPKQNKKDRVTEVVDCKDTDWFPPHSLDNIIKSYPITEEKPLFEPAPAYKPKNNSLSPFNIKNEWSLDDIQSMLDCVDADGNGVYDDWLAIGMALKDYGVPFGVYDAWCAKGSKYAGTVETRKKWDSFNGKGRSIGTLYYHAEKAGWKPATIEKKIEMVLSKKEIPTHNPETGETEDQPEQDKPKNKFHYINAPDVEIDLDVNDFVQGLLTESAMSVVYGESNCGKTFFMSDLAFHVAQGKEWNKKRVEKGNVLYLSLEGNRGIKNRIAAYKAENKVNLDGFLMMPCQVDFINSEEDITQLIELVKQANIEFNNDVKLIVIDTLARAIGGGDENSGVDMGTLVKHSDLIRQYTNAHICFIHHSGKDKARGARGHSSLRAAVDTEIEISRTEGADYSVVKVPKQRDMERDDDFQFKLKRVVLGVNCYNEEVTSCVVEPYDLQMDTEEKMKTKQVSGKTKAAFDALKEAIMEKGFKGSGQNMPNCKVVTIDVFKEYLQMRGILSENSRSAYTQYDRVSQKLIDEKLINIRYKYVWIAGDINVV